MFEAIHYGGHVVMVVGFDDGMNIIIPNKCTMVTTGAIEIINSLGVDGGESGYGCLLYENVI